MNVRETLHYIVNIPFYLFGSNHKETLIVTIYKKSVEGFCMQSV